MNGYFGEMMMVLVVVICAIVGLNLIVQTVFRELSEYKKKQNEPYEKALNTLLYTLSEGTKKMFNVMNKTMEQDMDRWKE